jgi:hypothetical protein
MAKIAKDAGISAGFLSQLLGGKVYKDRSRPRGARWETYERLGKASGTRPELWARSISRGKPELIIAAIKAADHHRTPTGKQTDTDEPDSA